MTRSESAASAALPPAPADWAPVLLDSSAASAPVRDLLHAVRSWSVRDAARFPDGRYPDGSALVRWWRSSDHPEPLQVIARATAERLRVLGLHRRPDELERWSAHVRRFGSDTIDPFESPSSVPLIAWSSASAPERAHLAARAAWALALDAVLRAPDARSLAPDGRHAATAAFLLAVAAPLTDPYADGPNGPSSWWERPALLRALQPVRSSDRKDWDLPAYAALAADNAAAWARFQDVRRAHPDLFPPAHVTRVALADAMHNPPTPRSCGALAAPQLLNACWAAENSTDPAHHLRVLSALVVDFRRAGAPLTFTADLDARAADRLAWFMGTALTTRLAQDIIRTEMTEAWNAPSDPGPQTIGMSRPHESPSHAHVATMHALVPGRAAAWHASGGPDRVPVETADSTACRAASATGVLPKAFLDEPARARLWTATLQALEVDPLEVLVHYLPLLDVHASIRGLPHAGAFLFAKMDIGPSAEAVIAVLTQADPDLPARALAHPLLRTDPRVTSHPLIVRPALVEAVAGQAATAPRRRL